MIYTLLISLLFVTGLHSTTYNPWAEQTLQNMSESEKIGQLFMIAAYVDPEYAKKEVGDAQIIEAIDEYIIKYSVGALAYVGPSSCIKQAALTNHYQTISKYPLLIAQDLEWGLGMRLSDGISFPKNETLGQIAVSRLNLIYELGKEIGREAKLLGVHINLSPVLDINTDPENISINVRSFGNNEDVVASFGVAMIQGLQDAGIIASAKHFPGLGSIKTDPHFDLPYSFREPKELEAVELYPFLKAIETGVLSIQTEHIVLPAISLMPASLSYEVITDLLKCKLGFKGVVISGALRMQALQKHFSEEEIIIQAFLAGNDLLLMPKDLPKAHQILQTALANNLISIEDINARVLKILRLKECVKLPVKKIINLPTLEEISPKSALDFNRFLYNQAISNQSISKKLPTFPTNFKKANKIAYIEIGFPSHPSCFEILKKQINLDLISFPSNPIEKKELDSLLKRLDSYDAIILACYPLDSRSIAKIRLIKGEAQTKNLKNFRVSGISDSMHFFIESIAIYQDKTLALLFGNSYGLPFFKNYKNLIIGYENTPEAQEAVTDLYRT